MSEKELEHWWCADCDEGFLTTKKPDYCPYCGKADGVVLAGNCDALYRSGRLDKVEHIQN